MAGELENLWGGHIYIDHPFDLSGEKTGFAPLPGLRQPRLWPQHLLYFSPNNP